MQTTARCTLPHCPNFQSTTIQSPGRPNLVHQFSGRKEAIPEHLRKTHGVKRLKMDTSRNDRLAYCCPQIWVHRNEVAPQVLRRLAILQQPGEKDCPAVPSLPPSPPRGSTPLVVVPIFKHYYLQEYTRDFHFTPFSADPQASSAFTCSPARDSWCVKAIWRSCRQHVVAKLSTTFSGSLQARCSILRIGKGGTAYCSSRCHCKNGYAKIFKEIEAWP